MSETIENFITNNPNLEVEIGPKYWNVDRPGVFQIYFVYGSDTTTQLMVDIETGIIV